MSDAKTMTLAELVKDELRMKAIMDDCKAGIAMIHDELADRLTKEKVDGMRVEGSYVSKYTLVNVNHVPFKQAKELGATKEVSDTVALRKLYDSGVKLKGVETSVHIRVTEAKE